MRTGGSTEERRKEVHARQELIKQHLVTHPDKPVKFNELASLFEVSDWTMRKDIATIAEEDTAINFLRGAVVYVPPTRYSGNKNEEGYSDPTASAVVSKVAGGTPTRENSFIPPRVGDVWDVKCSSGDIEKYIVLAINEEDSYATCILYYPEEDEMERSCKKLFSKPIRYFKAKCWGTPLSQLTRYKNLVRDYLEIDPEEKIVEKVIEKKVEIPVEVPLPEVKVSEEPVSSWKLYTQEELDMEITKMRAEIYKECLYLMAGRKEM